MALKIMVNGVVREMTPAEEAEYYAPEGPTAEDKAEAYDILTGVSE